LPLRLGIALFIQVPWVRIDISAAPFSSTAQPVEAATDNNQAATIFDLLFGTNLSLTNGVDKFSKCCC
jgi:hypothetical protein